MSYTAYAWQPDGLRLETSFPQDVRVPRYFRDGRLRVVVRTSLHKPARHERAEVTAVVRGACRSGP